MKQLFGLLKQLRDIKKEMPEPSQADKDAGDKIYMDLINFAQG